MIDLTGKRFGRLVAVKDSKKRDSCGNVIWECKCDCGNIAFVGSTSLIHGKTKSCGCLQLEILKKVNTIHGMTNSRLFRIWSHMLGRCYTKTDSKYYRYGGRGISICDEWKNNFLDFYKWSINNGYSECLTIDRINNNGNYEPSNCRWTDSKTQSRNTSRNRIITYCGESKCLSEWGEEYSIRPSVISKRLKRGWSTKEAITLPLGSRKMP